MVTREHTVVINPRADPKKRHLSEINRLSAHEALTRIGVAGTNTWQTREAFSEVFRGRRQEGYLRGRLSRCQ
jgi:hypothetical protein